EVVAAGRRLLVQRLLALRSVVADRGGAHERRRPVGAVEGSQALEEVARAEHPALLDRTLGPLAPTLGDTLAGEVHNRVASGESRGRSRFAQGLPGKRLDIQCGP